jgi:hypothetical protein
MSLKSLIDYQVKRGLAIQGVMDLDVPLALMLLLLIIARNGIIAK